MSKLTRVFQNLFGRDGDQSHFGQFGSRVTPLTGFPTKDPNSIQALSAFVNNGWKDAIVGLKKTPTLEDMNGLMYLIFYQLCYGFQEGVPEWNSATTYYIGSVVKKSGTFEFYGSLTDGNAGNALPSKTDNGYWHYLNPPSVQPGIVDAAAGPNAPFGYLKCDGTDYASASYPDLSTYLAGTWDTFRGQSSPGAGRFRTPALQGLTLIGVGGALGGVSARTLAQYVGEEQHTLTTTEIPAHSHPYGKLNPAINVDNTGSTRVAIFDSDGTGGSTSNAGGGAAHNNMQPSAGINWVIKY